MLKAIIVDDEKHCTDRLNRLIKECKSSIVVMGCFSRAEDAKIGIQSINPDLVFLDIQLDGVSAFDFLRTLNRINFQIIFTTAYDRYAIEAIRFSAFDYLLKPIGVEDLKKSIDRLNESSTDHLHSQIDNLFGHTENKNNEEKKIGISTGKGFLFEKVYDIVRCEAYNAYTDIFLCNGKKITASKVLKHFESLLIGCNFFRVHQSHLINLKYVKKYVKTKNGFVLMEDGSRVDVARRRKIEFMDAINQDRSIV